MNLFKKLAGDFVRARRRGPCIGDVGLGAVFNYMIKRGLAIF